MADSEAPLTDDTDLISERAQAFRNKLILDFHLLDMISETGGKLEPPKYYTSDLLHKKNLVNVLKTGSSCLVRFQVYSNKSEKQDIDPRENRIKTRNSKFPPLDLWAHWIIESSFFQNMILFLILVNSIVLGIQGELSDDHTALAEQTKFILEIFDYIAMVIYSVEIILKWVDNFWEFWKNRWNIFDFVITFLFFIPELISMVSGTWGQDNSTSVLTVISSNLRTFRILRSLKMVSRFQKVRLIVLAVTKAFQAMVFITVLLMVFAYIFAILGVMFFKDSYKAYLQDTNNQLTYTDSFGGIGSALITLFQLFTLDHWLDVYKDMMAVSAKKWMSAMYIIFWIIIGSFIFRNIFVGIMVNNFQSIRNDLFQEVTDIQDKEQRSHEMQDFAEEINRMHSESDIKINEGESIAAMPDPMLSRRRRSSMARRNSIMAGGGPLDFGLPPPPPPPKSPQVTASGPMSGIKEIQKNLTKGDPSSKGDPSNTASPEWQSMLEHNLHNLAKEEAYFLWPKDTMFRYLIIMEHLQENLREREQLITLIGQALVDFHDL